MAIADREFLENLFGLDGKVALVTGASSGLGARFAQALALAGARVLVCARRENRLRELVDSIALAGGRAAALRLDVTDEAAVKEAFDAAEAAFGPVDILVNSAGVSKTGLATEMSTDDWDAVVGVNLRAVFVVAREGARRMVAQGIAGSIVNIASILGSFGAKGEAAYSASKGGVIQLTRSMALELARHGIRVNAIAPGYFVSEMTASYLETEPGARMIKGIPMRRVGEPAELDAALLMLAGAGGSYITGSVVTVDGGHSQAIP
jgi:NAD(P)-dependent dehydrogenase (short-subunit alcohol dehydrogenase family)